MVSCKPLTGKKAVEFGKNAVESYRKINDNEVVKVAKTVNRLNSVYEFVNSSSSYYICSSCGGYGYVFYYNDYGYIITDGYGYPIPYICPTCNGKGYTY